MKLIFKTPAKINLGLRIIGKREDGYHELETVMQMVSLYDGIEMECRESGVEFQCDHPDIPNDQANLVMKAERLMRETFRVGLGVRIKLSKKIPHGAGLGGGSGNAAGTLLGLNVLWDLQLPQGKLLELGAKLGSDVPFFLASPCALGKGRGELLTPLQPARKFYVILIYPRFPIATSWVYGNLKLGLTKTQNNISILQKFLSQSEISGLGASLQNDLEPGVIQRFPAIQVLKDRLRDCGADGALMSGSGSTVFGIFADSVKAERAFAHLKNKDMELFLTETVNHFSEFLPEEMVSYIRLQ